jgi:hypothetical protein
MAAHGFVVSAVAEAASGKRQAPQKQENAGRKTAQKWKVSRKTA